VEVTFQSQAVVQGKSASVFGQTSPVGSIGKRRKGVRAVAVLVLLVGSVAWYWLSGRASVEKTDNGLMVMVAPRGSGGMNAGISGQVTKDGQCVGLDGNLTIWPRGTTVHGNRLLVGGRSYGLGDHFDGGGGVAEQKGDDFDPMDVDAPEGCPVTDKLIILSP
jgi:hypothetical protein